MCVCICTYEFLDFIDGVRLRFWTAATNGHIVHPTDDVCVWRTTVEWYWQGKTQIKTCPSATFSTTNPTWINPGANTELRCERPEPEPWHGPCVYEMSEIIQISAAQTAARGQQTARQGVLCGLHCCLPKIKIIKRENKYRSPSR
jgi:hypothetical protein